jgi:hypothetical protein
LIKSALSSAATPLRFNMIPPWSARWKDYRLRIRDGEKGFNRQCIKIDHYLSRPHYYLARDYARLGDHDAALAELNQSYQSHDLEILWILTDPDMDSLRSDPRFQRLINEIGFPN